MAGGFLNRWSRRKAEKSIESPQIEQPSIAAPLNPQEIVIEPVPQPVPNPALASLEDVDKIDRMAPDFSAFMQAGVDPAVQQAALKKMFTDPHFNVMDGLDIYIDDYSKPDPIPLEMLKRLVQSDMLGIFNKQDDGSVANKKVSPVLSPEHKIAEQVLPLPDQTDLTSKNLAPVVDGDKLTLAPADKKTS
jgi:hypothetical protein